MSRAPIDADLDAAIGRNRTQAATPTFTATVHIDRRGR
jgi:hypothetical protein